MMPDYERLTEQLRALGLREGDTVMVHSSFRALGIRDPETILRALLAVLGESGTLLLPGLSYKQEPHHIHSVRDTPTCVGFLSEYFRTRPGTLRSVHPTHSVCGIGAELPELLTRHILDTTPCGPHSPFRRVLQRGGKILILGCGLCPNTSMHAVEEYANPPYLFGPPIRYTITDADGKTFEKEYTPHGFAGYEQRYDRVADIMGRGDWTTGMVGRAESHLILGEALLEKALAKMREDPFYFVDRAEEAEQGTHDAPGAGKPG